MFGAGWQEPRGELVLSLRGSRAAWSSRARSHRAGNSKTGETILTCLVEVLGQTGNSTQFYFGAITLRMF